MARFTVPYGADGSLFDMFKGPVEVVQWLQDRRIVARLDNTVTREVERNGGISVQVLDLDNAAAHRRYVQDLSYRG